MQELRSGEITNARRHDLDALRGIAMLLGIALHAALAYLGAGWTVVDAEASPLLAALVSFTHGFRMPLFFALSGFFSAMLFQQRGLGGLLKHRAKRVLLPLVVSCVTIVPVMWVVVIVAGTENPTYAVPRSNQNLWTAAALGDLEQVKEFAAFGWPLDETDPFFRQTPLAWAISHDHPEIVKHLLDAGADPNATFGWQDLDTPLQSAAFFGRAACARLLLKAGANPNAQNDKGETPLDAIRHGAEVVNYVGALLKVEVDFAEVRTGRAAVRDMLVAQGGVSGLSEAAPMGTPQAAVKPKSDSGSGVIGAVLSGLMYFPFFHHLWFLWLLCWLVVGFAAASAILSAVPFRLRVPWSLVASPLALAWLVPLTMLTQAAMFSGSIIPGFGPDTSAGLVPIPHVLGHYAIFFGFGALAFLIPGAAERLGTGWWLLLPLAVALYPIAHAISSMTPWGYEIAGDESTRRTLSALGQSLFCWLMIFGSVGLCRRLLAGERFWVRYISDSSYWLYLVHLPVVILGQMLVRPLPLPALVKFSLVLLAATGLLLASYEWGVRYTFIGRGLNGPRTRSTP